MAENSYPFENTSVTEAEYTRLFSEFQSTGVIGGWGSNALRVSANGSGMSVTLSAGLAIVRGHAYHNTSARTLSIPAASGTARQDAVVLELNPTNNEIVAKVIPNGAFSLTQTATGIYQMLLCIVQVTTSAVVISANNLTDRRPWVGRQVGVWSNFTRPGVGDRRVGFTGYNAERDRLEYWDGTAWKAVGARTWSDITGKPSTFPPSGHSHTWDSITNKPRTFAPIAHSHSWSQITGKPTTFVPIAHNHSWPSITNKPSTFPPSSHSHAWSQITGKPSSFNPAPHTHNGGQITTSVAHAIQSNGSMRPHHRSVSGPGPWYSVWVRADGGFCRNTSSIKYKENVRDYSIDPEAVLHLQPRIFDRKPTVDDDGTEQPGVKDEVGLIAEEVEEFLPEVIIKDEEGETDGIRIDLITLGLIETAKAQAAQIKALEARLSALEGKGGVEA